MLEAVRPAGKCGKRPSSSLISGTADLCLPCHQTLHKLWHNYASSSVIAGVATLTSFPDYTGWS